MEDTVNFVRDNLYWIVFGGFILWNFFRRKKISPELTAIMFVDSIEQSYLSEKRMELVDLSSFPVGSQGYPDDIASQLEQVGLCPNCSIKFDVKIWSFEAFYRVIRDPDGLVSVDLSVFVSKNKVIHYAWSAFTRFSDGRFMTTFPSTESETNDWGRSFLDEVSGFTTVADVILRHRQRVAEYLASNPGVTAIAIMDYDDLMDMFESERVARKKYLPLKGCLLTRREFDVFCPSMPSATREKIWIAFQAEEKKRGYIPGGPLSQSQRPEEPIKLVASAGDAEIVALADDDLPEEDEYLRSVRIDMAASGVEKKDPWRGLWTLLITMVIFFNLGWFKWGMDFVLLLIVVIFIHELGHYMAMKLSGYRNLQMFFIPLLGAAVSGQGHSVPTYKKVIVSLAGPLPGIVIGVVLIWYAMAYNSEFCRHAGFLFMFLNGFNLIPFMPLDGGWVLYHTLSSRSYIFDTALRVLAVGIFAYLGFKFNYFIFYLLAAVNFLGASASFKEAGFLRQFKRDIAEYDQLHSPGAGSSDLAQIPTELLAKMVEYIREKKKKRLSTLVAREVVDLWEKANNKPTGVISTILLWMLLLVVGWGGIGFGFVLDSGALAEVFADSVIVQAVDESGKTVLLEKTYSYNNPDNIVSSVELTDDGTLYHGSGKFYVQGNIFATTQWDNGSVGPEIIIYDETGEPTLIATCENGEVVSVRKKDSDDNWQEVDPDYNYYYLSDRIIEPICNNYRSGPEESVIDKWRLSQ